MRPVSLRWLVLFVNILGISVPVSSFAGAGLCSDLFVEARGLKEPEVDWKSERSYLEAMDAKQTMGQVETFFSEKWDTQIYHTNTGLPNAKGQSPLVDPNSKGVFIFFHGSGTMKSSGRNFLGNMNTLANLGYSGISFDMPFHGQGPRSEAFNDSKYFMEWVRSIVLEARKSGKPIYLVGHSFGPDVALEFATRYPKIVDGVAGLSPAGYTKELSKWYDNVTSKMNFGGNVASNDAGGVWAGTMSNQFLWAKKKLADPTVINPNMRVRILSGNLEEYVPGPTSGEGDALKVAGPNTYDVRVPLSSFFRNAVITVEPGVGHYLFDHVDSDGLHVVTRELLLTAGEDPHQIKKITEQVVQENQNLHASGQLAKRYVQDPIFKAWADLAYGKGTVMRVTQQYNDKLSQKILADYVLAVKARDQEIFQKIINTKETNPEFYHKYQAIIDAYKPNRVETTLFKPYLLLVLNAPQG
jgi:pimeloyl-ACP methyl ester carboxylesterase